MARVPRARLATLKPLVGQLDQRVAQPAPKITDPLYGSAEHKAWRAEVIRRANGRCQAPGCTRTGVMLFADHIVEVKDGGAKFDPNNGQAFCGSHHGKKTAAERDKRMTSRP